MTLTVNGKGLHGVIPAVASKSMAHRLLICAALSEAPSIIRCESLSDDITATADCLSGLFANVEYSSGKYTVFPEKVKCNAHIDCNESGSTLRFLIPVICAVGGGATIKMHGRLPERPLSPLREELCRMGADISDGVNPLIITGTIVNGDYTLSADVSSQFISGLLFALPLLNGDSKLILKGNRESVSYIDMTISALALFGICIKQTDFGYIIPGGQKYLSPGEIFTEGDWSNSAFWLCASYPEESIRVSGLSDNSLQGDKAVKQILEDMRTDSNIRIDCRNIPDLVPALSVAACKRKGNTEFINAGRLRIKESDRLKSVAEMLSTLGGKVVEKSEGLIVYPSLLHPGTVDSYGDHRIAMAAAAASTCAGDVTIKNAECAAKSYPSFFDDFAALGGTVI